jgi:hypothetical protein
MKIPIIFVSSSVATYELKLVFTKRRLLSLLIHDSFTTSKSLTFNVFSDKDWLLNVGVAALCRQQIKQILLLGELFPFCVLIFQFWQGKRKEKCVECHMIFMIDGVLNSL